MAPWNPIYKSPKLPLRAFCVVDDHRTRTAVSSPFRPPQREQTGGWRPGRDFSGMLFKCIPEKAWHGCHPPYAKALPASPRQRPYKQAGGGVRDGISRRCSSNASPKKPGTDAAPRPGKSALLLVRADAIVRAIRDGLPHHRLRPLVAQDSRQLRRGVHLEQFRRHFRARAAPMTRHHVQIYRDQLAYLAHTASLGCCPDRIRRVEQRLYRKKVTPPARIVNAPAP